MSDLQTIFGQGGFATNSVAPAADFLAIPPGKYPVLIESAEMKPTKKNDGHYVELVLVILEGTCQGRKIWERINIDNPNQKCVEIGCAQLAALGLALEIANVTTVQQLLQGQVVAHVKVKGDQNEVRTWSSIRDYSAVAPQQAAAVTQVAQPMTQAPPPQQQAPPYQPPQQPQQQQQQPPPGTVPWARSQ